jgi:SAM-dependent methyltransferase
VKAFWIPLLGWPVGEAYADVSFAGQRNGEELIEGELIAAGRTIGAIRKGMAVFEGSDDRLEEVVQKLRRENRLALRCPNPKVSARRTNPSPGERLFYEWLDELTTFDGPILEVAAGPGGGSVLAILQPSPQAPLMFNDISVPVVALWRDFFAEHGIGPNVCFSAFDAARVPLRGESMAAVTSSAGFGNMDLKAQSEAIHEAFRVLRPGGLLCAEELVLEAEGLSRLPSELRQEWSKEVVVRGLSGFLSDAGFVVESQVVEFCRPVDPQQDGVAEKAAKYGVSLAWNIERVKARKPE